ncbi:MAG TPA: metallophosphatase domain-containing protein [Urbifossiella sp.]|nr:metallophosphatase domain-containing protein [Urbifossiella sp.]
MKVVCISDTHGSHRRLAVPPGDLLIHAGDVTVDGYLDELDDFNQWLGSLPHPNKVLIAGNHDFCFQEQASRARARITNAMYLEDDSAIVAGVKIYGSPWQPYFGGWAFNLRRGEPLAAVWAKIPDDADILVTHSPPEGILDRNRWGEPCGCRDLLNRVREVRPRLHVFGHIHEAAGLFHDGATTFVNASQPPRHATAAIPEPMVVEL